MTQGFGPPGGLEGHRVQGGLHRFPHSFQLLRRRVKGRRQHCIQNHILQSFLQQHAKLLHCQRTGKKDSISQSSLHFSQEPYHGKQTLLLRPKCSFSCSQHTLSELLASDSRRIGSGENAVPACLSPCQAHSCQCCQQTQSPSSAWSQTGACSEDTGLSVSDCRCLSLLRSSGRHGVQARYSYRIHREVVHMRCLAFLWST